MIKIFTKIEFLWRLTNKYYFLYILRDSMFLPRLLSASRLAVQSTANYVLARDIFLLAIPARFWQQIKKELYHTCTLITSAIYRKVKGHRKKCKKQNGLGLGWLVHCDLDASRKLWELKSEFVESHFIHFIPFQIFSEGGLSAVLVFKVPSIT